MDQLQEQHWWLTQAATKYVYRSAFARGGGHIGDVGLAGACWWSRLLLMFALCAGLLLNFPFLKRSTTSVAQPDSIKIVGTQQHCNEL
jgi:hypothetical protein